MVGDKRVKGDHIKISGGRRKAEDGRRKIGGLP